MRCRKCNGNLAKHTRRNHAVYGCIFLASTNYYFELKGGWSNADIQDQKQLIVFIGVMLFGFILNYIFNWLAVDVLNG